MSSPLVPVTDDQTVSVSMQLLKATIMESVTSANAKLHDVLCAKMESLNRELQETFEIRLHDVETRVQNLDSKLSAVAQTASDTYDTSDTNLKTITLLSSRVAELERKITDQERNNEDFKRREKDYIESIEEIQISLDDQINRSMRSNLVFLGLQETEARGQSTTKDIVSDFIFNKLHKETDDVTLEAINRTIVRAHRGKSTGDRKKPRPIYVKFNRDDTAAVLLQQSRKMKVSGNGVSVRPQHTKPLQDRVNNALKHRRQLLDEGSVIKAFVEYPATLKGVLSSSSNPNEYSVIKSF